LHADISSVFEASQGMGYAANSIVEQILVKANV